MIIKKALRLFWWISPHIHQAVNFKKRGNWLYLFIAFGAKSNSLKTFKHWYFSHFLSAILRDENRLIFSLKPKHAIIFHILKNIWLPAHYKKPQIPGRLHAVSALFNSYFLFIFIYIFILLHLFQTIHFKCILLL